MSDNPITITINGVTHKFQPGDVDAMRDLPWPERKQLIELLENIKQAEYVNAQQPDESSTDVGLNSRPNATPQSTPKTPAIKTIQSSLPPQLDPAIKPSDQDADDLMNRLILEQQQNHKPVPDKSSVIKLLLVIFAIIIALALIF